MRGALEVGVRTGVAGQTASVNLLGGSAFKDENLGFIAAAGDVVRAGTVAAFAALMRGPTFCIEPGLPMRRSFPGVVEFFVTALASLRANISRGFVGRCAGRRGALRGWGLLRGLGGVAASGGKRGK